jgi:hypothetical protein
MPLLLLSPKFNKWLQSSREGIFIFIIFTTLKSNHMSKPHQPGKAETTETVYVPKGLTLDQWEDLDGLFTNFMTFEDMQYVLAGMKERYLTLYLSADDNLVDKQEVLDDITHINHLLDVGKNIN